MTIRLSSRQVDELLDERLAHCGRANQDVAACRAGRFGRADRLAAALNGGHRAAAAAVVNPCASHAAKSM